MVQPLGPGSPAGIGSLNQSPLFSSFRLFTPPSIALSDIQISEVADRRQDGTTKSVGANRPFAAKGLLHLGTRCGKEFSAVADMDEKGEWQQLNANSDRFPFKEVDVT